MEWDFNLDVSQVGSCVVLEHIRQQEAQQVLQLLQIILQWRSRQHDALLAQHRHPARAQSSVTIT
jgi:aspartate carbamoyltransferase regulatory subunit